MRTTSKGCSQRNQNGFTLVEIMIVVVIIGLLTVLAIPAIQRVQIRAQNTRFISDLRTFSQAFETYALENGTWPPNAGSGIVPSTLVGAISSTAWTTTNTITIGGPWNWDVNRMGIVSGISTMGITASIIQRLDIDAAIDDGHLSTGRLQYPGSFRLRSGRVMCCWSVWLQCRKDGSGYPASLLTMAWRIGPQIYRQNIHETHCVGRGDLRVSPTYSTDSPH